MKGKDVGRKAFNFPKPKKLYVFKVIRLWFRDCFNTDDQT